MSIGWFIDLSDAEAYFEDERSKTEAWDDLVEASGDLQKSKAIRNAYNRIYHDPRWSLPTYAEASASELSVLRIVNGEMAYYLAEHLSDEDRRKGLQAQGVIKAGVVKEDYSESMLMKLPVPPFVIALLEPWSTESNFAAVGLVRDEEEDIYF